MSEDISIAHSPTLELAKTLLVRLISHLKSTCEAFERVIMNLSKYNRKRETAEIVARFVDQYTRAIESDKGELQQFRKLDE